MIVCRLAFADKQIVFQFNPSTPVSHKFCLEFKIPWNEILQWNEIWNEICHEQKFIAFITFAKQFMPALAHTNVPKRLFRTEDALQVTF